MLPTRERAGLTGRQPRQDEWRWQWARLQGEEGQTERLFWEWVWPLTPDDFRGKRVLDAGCGGGHMLGYLRDLVAEGVGVDLNTAALVRRRHRGCPHLRIYEGDLATWGEEGDFDVVYSIGVVHHTQAPQRSARNLMKLVKPGGKLVIWAYGHEGNFWARALVERPKPLYRWLPRPVLMGAARALAGLLHPVVHTVYRLPLPWLPYYDYFRNWRRLSFARNCTNVFDKLNAPTTHFVRRGDVDRWFAGMPFSHVEVSDWCRISWRVCATRDAS